MYGWFLGLVILSVVMAFPWLLWQATRRFGIAGGIAAVGTLAAVLGVIGFLRTCSIPMTCDVGGPGTFRVYFMTYFPRFAFLSALALTIAALGLGWRWRRGTSVFSWREGTIGALLFFASWTMVVLIFAGLGSL